MIIDRTALEACLQWLIAEARYRREGVGLLSGPLDAPVRAAGGLLDNVTVDEWSPLTNVAEFPRVRYEVDPAELVDAYNNLEDLGYRPYVLVHSHLRGGGTPSPNDVRMAGNPALLHMIVDLEPARPVPYLWRLAPNEEPLKIRYQIADLRQQAISPTDLTRGVSQA